MSTRWLYDPSERLAVLYDSVTGLAFGPTIDEQAGMTAEETADAFVAWVEMLTGDDDRPGDIRALASEQVSVMFNVFSETVAELVVAESAQDWAAGLRPDQVADTVERWLRSRRNARMAALATAARLAEAERTAAQ